MKKIILTLLLISILVPLIGLATALPEPPPLIDPVDALTTIANVLFGILVLAAVIFIILGAFSLLTADGDETKIGTGRQKILYAIIAVVVAMLARGLVEWIRGVF